ncbi:Proteasome subunit beta type-5, partial [Globisporangium splendens]|uniref:Proteasome subunit beta n=1 Tax=Globisporangium ultimum (strain ATCC 200006 / CBS 805.95 / DAOM BR144) TaxID=431595 RepID=K3WUL7_GLOUD
MSAPVMKLDFLRAGSRGSTMSYGGAMPNMHMPMHDQLDVAATVPDALGSGFLLPPVADPAEYSRTNFKVKYTEDNDQTLKFAKGTTTLAFVYNGGIVVAVDSRSTMGPFIASGQVKKINPINDYMLATMAGSAADCQYWQRNLAVQCRMYELRNRHRISVRAASKLIANTCNYYKRYGMSLGMMLMGYDNGKPTLYYVDDEGSRFRASEEIPKFSVGSGSTYAYGVLDTNWRWDLTDDEAVELGKNAIYHATHRDAYSGGMCNVYIFKPDGFKHVVHQDVDELHDHDRAY